MNRYEAPVKNVYTRLEEAGAVLGEELNGAVTPLFLIGHSPVTSRSTQTQREQREKSLKAHAPRTYTHPTQPIKPPLAFPKPVRSAGWSLWLTLRLALCIRGVILDLTWLIESVKVYLISGVLRFGTRCFHAYLNVLPAAFVSDNTLNCLLYHSDAVLMRLSVLLAADCVRDHVKHLVEARDADEHGRVALLD